MLPGANGVQHIAGLGDVRQVYLGPDFVFRVRGLGALGLATLHSLLLRLEMGAHLFRLIRFQRTRVRFLLGNPDGRKYVQDRFALDFQLPGQIVDSNLAHPPSSSSALSR